MVHNVIKGFLRDQRRVSILKFVVSIGGSPFVRRIWSRCGDYLKRDMHLHCTQRNPCTGNRRGQDVSLAQSVRVAQNVCALLDKMYYYLKL